MRSREITIKLLKKQIADDITVECNLLGSLLQQTAETRKNGARIMTPDDDEVKPIVARAMTEAFGEVKRQCQRYLILGRDSDDNRLERINEMDAITDKIKPSDTGTQSSYNMEAGKKYLLRITSSAEVKILDGTVVIATVNGLKELEYTPASSTILKVVGDSTTSCKIKYLYGEFGYYELRLDMPEAFNVGLTETVKSNAHRSIVDYIMYKVLFNQLPEKAEEYRKRFDDSQDRLSDSLDARVDNFSRRSADWS
jgi:hypothetical protein